MEVQGSEVRSVTPEVWAKMSEQDKSLFSPDMRAQMDQQVRLMAAGATPNAAVNTAEFNNLMQDITVAAVDAAKNGNYVQGQPVQMTWKDRRVCRAEAVKACACGGRKWWQVLEGIPASQDEMSVFLAGVITAVIIGGIVYLFIKLFF